MSAEVVQVAKLHLGIPVNARPYHQGPSVLAFYDGPMLMVLTSPRHGDFLALALSPGAGQRWPFLITPITPDQANAVRAGLDAGAGAPPSGSRRGVRQHFLEARQVYLLRDFGARDLVGLPVSLPIPAEWLPHPDF